MTDINTHISEAKRYLGQRKLNHALDEIVVALELLNESRAEPLEQDAPVPVIEGGGIRPKPATKPVRPPRPAKEA